MSRYRVKKGCDGGSDGLYLFGRQLGKHRQGEGGFGAFLRYWKTAFPVAEEFVGFLEVDGQQNQVTAMQPRDERFLIG